MKLNINILLLATTLLITSLGMFPVAQAADAAVATVNGKPIKQSLLDFIVKDAGSHGQKIDDNTRSIIVSKLISNELVYQEAQRQGLDKQSDFIAREELARRELLVNAYLQDYLKKNPVSEADTRSAYEKFKTEVGDKEYSARHILVATEAEAKDIIAQLAKGGDFAKIAKEKSKDTGSKLSLIHISSPRDGHLSIRRQRQMCIRDRLVATEAEAKDIIAQLAKGGDFAKIAKEKSKDTGSKDKGGDLGWFSPGGMV